MDKKKVKTKKKPSAGSSSVELNSNDHNRQESLNGDKTLTEESQGEILELKLVGRRARYL